MRSIGCSRYSYPQRIIRQWIYGGVAGGAIDLSGQLQRADNRELSTA